MTARHHGPRAKRTFNPADDEDLDAGPGAGVRNQYAADPLAALHPMAVGTVDVHLLTQGRATGAQGSGDSRPPVHRPGSDRFTALPSRMGDQLRWPDGRVTDLNGRPLLDRAA